MTRLYSKTEIFYPHLMVDPVQEVGDVAINTKFILRSAVSHPNTVPNEPPYSVLQGHQRAAAVGLRKSLEQNGWCFFYELHTLEETFNTSSI